LGKKFFPYIVKSTKFTKDYPGYSYEYFQSFEELDNYLRLNCGENWIDQNWAKFWLRDYWKENKRENRVPSRNSKKQKEVNSKKPKHIIKMFILHYHKRRKYSYRRISKVLKEKHGINVSIATISRVINDKEGYSARKSL